MEFTGERYIPGSIADSCSTGREHWQRYLYTAQYVSGKVVLDIASGEGYGSDYLAQTAQQVYGVDIDAKAIEYATSHYTKDNLTFLIGSVGSIPLDDKSVDVIVSYETLEHVDSSTQTQFLNEIKRVLRPDGMLVISCPNKAIATDRAFKLWGYTNEFHLKELYFDEFASFLQSAFKNTVIMHQRTEAVQIISNCNTKYLDVILSDKKDYSDTQNMIAFCSDLPLELSDRGSIVFDTDLVYLQRDQQLSELSHALEGPVSQVNETGRQLDDTQVQLADKQAHLADAQAQLADAQAQLADTQLQLADTQLQLANTQLQLADTQLQLADMQVQLADMKKQFTEEHKKLEQSISNAANLCEKIEGLEHSTSWRITKPLRFIGHLLRR